MDLVEKNIALTQEHKVLEALMKLRTISIMNISAQSSNLSLLYLNFIRLLLNFRNRKSKESTKESQRLEALKLAWVSTVPYFLYGITQSDNAVTQSTGFG